MVAEKDSLKETKKVLLGTRGSGRKTRFWTSKRVFFRRVSLEDGSIDDLFVCC